MKKSWNVPETMQHNLSPEVSVARDNFNRFIYHGRLCWWRLPNGLMGNETKNKTIEECCHIQRLLDFHSWIFPTKALCCVACYDSFRWQIRFSNAKKYVYLPWRAPVHNH